MRYNVDFFMTDHSLDEHSIPTLPDLYPVLTFIALCNPLTHSLTPHHLLLLPVLAMQVSFFLCIAQKEQSI